MLSVAPTNISSFRAQFQTSSNDDSKIKIVFNDTKFWNHNNDDDDDDNDDDNNNDDDYDDYDDDYD